MISDKASNGRAEVAIYYDAFNYDSQQAGFQ
jgi:hypothetical protein